MFPTQEVYKSTLILKTYTGEPIQIFVNLHTYIRMHVKYGQQFAKLVLVVVDGNVRTTLSTNRVAELLERCLRCEHTTHHTKLESSVHTPLGQR